MNCDFLEFEALHVNGALSFYFELGNRENNRYSINIKVDEEGNILYKNCTCLFGSYYKYSKKNREMNKECRHIKKALEFIKHLGYIK